MPTCSSSSLSRSSLVYALVLDCALLAACPAPDSEGGGEGESETDAGETDETETETGSDEAPASCDLLALEHAPPPLEIAPGVMAEPMDVLAVTARIEFDLVHKSGSATATLDFRAGPEGYAQFFDLRQPILGLELDGEPLEPEAVVPILVDEYTEGSLLALMPLEPCSEHSLRIDYQLTHPAARYAVGPKYGAGELRWETRMSDQQSGRYLESWIPSGLIFDRFALELELELVGFEQEHELLSNSEQELLGPGRWRMSWAALAPFDPLWVVRPSEDHLVLAGTHAAPDGAMIPYELWVDEDYLDLAAQLHASTLASVDEFVVDYGAYPHAKLVAYLAPEVAGMEYRGAFVSHIGAIRHETHHQWWGRGLSPALGRDGWFDEAWTQYTDPLEYAPALSFEDDEPVALRPPSPYRTITYGVAYSLGHGFFEHLALVVGDAELRAAMNELRLAHPLDSVDSVELEHHLYCALGEEEAVRRAFWRWIYGNEGEPEAAPAELCE